MSGVEKKHLINKGVRISNFCSFRIFFFFLIWLMLDRPDLCLFLFNCEFFCGSIDVRLHLQRCLKSWSATFPVLIALATHTFKWKESCLSVAYFSVFTGSWGLQVSWLNELFSVFLYIHFCDVISGAYFLLNWRI